MLGKITFLEYTGEQNPEATFLDLLTDNQLSPTWGLMEVPSLSFTLPAKYQIMLQPRRKVRVEYQNWVFDGFIMGIDLDNHGNKVTVDLIHVVSELTWYKLPTNLSVKAELIPDVLSRSEFQLPQYLVTFDELAAAIDIDYLFSNESILDAYTTICNNTDEVYWRINRRNPYLIEFGRFGEDTGIEISKDKYLISDVDVRQDFGTDVINYAVILADKTDSGASSVTLQDIRNDSSLQDPKFPVVLTSSTGLTNNERSYANYARARIPQFASNTDVEYAVMDLDGIGMMEGALCYGYFASNDLQPHSNTDTTELGHSSTTVRSTDKVESVTDVTSHNYGNTTVRITTTKSTNKTTGRVTTRITTTKTNKTTGITTSDVKLIVNVTGHKVQTHSTRLIDHSKGLAKAIANVEQKGHLVTEEYNQLQNNTHDEFRKYMQPIFNAAGFAGDLVVYLHNQNRGTKDIPASLVIQAVDQLKADPASAYNKEQAAIAAQGGAPAGTVTNVSSSVTTASSTQATTLFKDENEARVLLQNNSVTVTDWNNILTALKNIVGMTSSDLLSLTQHYIRVAITGKLTDDSWDDLTQYGAAGLQRYITPLLPASWAFLDAVHSGMVTYNMLHSALIEGTTTGIYAGGIANALNAHNSTASDQPPAITNADRIQTAIVMYQRAIRQLKHSRPRIEYDLQLEGSIYKHNFQVGQLVHFDYSNTQVEQLPCGDYYNELLHLNDEFYIIKIQDNETSVNFTIAKDLYRERGY